MQHDPDSSDWQACPPGTLKRFSVYDRKRSTKRQARFAVGLGLSLILFVGMTFVVIQRGTTRPDLVQPDPMALNCIEVRGAIDDYFAGELGASRRAAVEQHLSNCRHCRPVYEKRARTLQIGMSVASLMRTLTPTITQIAMLDR